MKYFSVAFALFALLQVSQGVDVERKLAPQPLTTVIANDFGDRVIRSLRDLCLNISNCDPLMIKHLAANITYNFLFNEHVAQVELDDMILLGLSSFQRSGDVEVIYDLMYLTINLNITVPSISGGGNFKAKIAGFNPDGVFAVTITEQNIRLSIRFDLLETTAALQDFSLDNNGKVHLTLDGLGLLGDPLANVFIAALTGFFKDSIVTKLGEGIAEAIVQLLENIPPLLPKCSSAESLNIFTNINQN